MDTNNADSLAVETADGRQLEVRVTGSADDLVLLYHSGTPSGVASFEALESAAQQRNLRLVTYSRPGYGSSSPHLGRSVADAASDVAEILDRVGADRFVTLGWSGGGPHALACAALLSDRCAAAAILAGVGPSDGAGLDWLNGMGPENIDEFGAAVAGIEPLSQYLTENSRPLVDVTAEDVAAALGGLAPPVDRAALTGDLADYLARSFRRAVVSGIAGWRDDDLAFAKPWGFSLQTMSVPVSVWQGGQDLMVPVAHGRWLADHVNGARAHLYPEEGHVSLAQQMGRILDDLLALAAQP